MNSVDFLKKELESLSNSFTGIEIRYEFREKISTHIIEILPLNIYKSNKRYIDAEIELEKGFSNEFPSEEILFISEDSLTQIYSPDLIINQELHSF